MVHEIVRPVLGTIVAVKTLDILGQTIKRTRPKRKKKKTKRRRK